MARIRTIKPEFFTSEDIVSLTPLARLFYVSLWCESDREGRLEWKPRTLKYRYLPGDDCSVEDLGDELIKSGLIVLYEVDGKVYAEIPGFKKHQVINNRESESTIPPKNDDAPFTRESDVKAEGKEGKEGKGKEGIKEKEEKENPDASPPAQPAPQKSTGAKVTGTRLPENFQVPDDWIDWATDERPDIPPPEMRTVAESFVDYWAAKAGAAARKVDWLATWRNWVRNQKRYSSPPAKRQKFDPTAYVNRNRVPSHDIIDI